MRVSSDKAVGGMHKCRFPEPLASVRVDGGKELPKAAFATGDSSIIYSPQAALGWEGRKHQSPPSPGFLMPHPARPN
jgi:hypothetical protein